MALSRPVGYGLLAAVVVGALLFTNDPAAPNPTKPPARRRTSTKKDGADWALPAPDPKLRFPRTTGTPRNVFVPRVVVEKRLPAVGAETPPEDLVQIPAKLAGGESAWAYTGMVEANGVRMALLENKGTKVAGYVREGDAWKAARVVGITSACIVLADEKGKAETVFRLDPNAPPKPKPVPGSEFGSAGVGPNLVGPINPGSPGNAIRPLPDFTRGSTR